MQSSRTCKRAPSSRTTHRICRRRVLRLGKRQKTADLDLMVSPWLTGAVILLFFISHEFLDNYPQIRFALLNTYSRHFHLQFFHDVSGDHFMRCLIVGYPHTIATSYPCACIPEVVPQLLINHAQIWFAQNVYLLETGAAVRKPQVWLFTGRVSDEGSSKLPMVQNN